MADFLPVFDLNEPTPEDDDNNIGIDLNMPQDDDGLDEVYIDKPQDDDSMAEVDIDEPPSENENGNASVFFIALADMYVPQARI